MSETPVSVFGVGGTTIGHRERENVVLGRSGGSRHCCDVFRTWVSFGEVRLGRRVATTGDSRLVCGVTG